MFLSFLKSTESLERELRQWSYEDIMRLMPPEESDEWQSFCAERDLMDLVKSVAASCFSRREEARAMKALVGKEPDHREIWRALKGSKLVHDIAKRKGWNLIFHGAPALGYTCEIQEL